MTKNEAIERIEAARALLDEVYSYYADPETEFSRSLSVADTCCEEALNDLLGLEG